MHIEPEAADTELAFASQLGVDCVFMTVAQQHSSVDELRSIKARVEDHGLALYNVGSHDYMKNHWIHLTLPERDQMIRRFQDFVLRLGQAGIGVTTFTWEPDKVWSTDEGGGHSRGAIARYVDLDELVSRLLTHDRVYSREELWDRG